MPYHPGTSSSRQPWQLPVRPAFQPDCHTAPADLWQQKAEKFIFGAQASLLKNTDVLSERGISAAAAVTFRLGWNPGEEDQDIYRARKSWGLQEILKEDGRPKALWIPRGLVIPCLIDNVIHRVRIRRPEGKPRYYVLPGSSMATMFIGPERRAFVIVESELDAIAVASCQGMAGAVAMGSVSAKPDLRSSRDPEGLHADPECPGLRSRRGQGDDLVEGSVFPMRTMARTERQRSRRGTEDGDRPYDMDKSGVAAGLDD
jgi:hypothetical protein